jgi:uncharacterized protein (TIGR02679 family)
MTVAVARARLARPRLRPLVDELARRFGDGPDPPVRVTLRRLTSEQRDGLADLLGATRLPPATLQLPLARLCSVLELDDIGELRAIVEELRGPIVDRSAARAAARSDRESLWEWLHGEVESLEIEGVGAVRGWTAVIRRDGVRGGIARHRRRLADTVDVLRALPADGVPLAAFADDVLGDPHALDRGHSVSRLVLGALAHARGEPAPADAEESRRLWEAAGVAPDPLSSTVLALGLAAARGHPLAGLLALSAEAVEPVVLTLAQLRRWPLAPLPSSRVVYVVENPSIIAAGSARGWSGPPLVCSSGRPTVAVLTLLRQLAAGRATVLQHADFDATGLAITAWLAQRAGTVPWRMSAADYRAAVAVRRDRVPIRGTVPSTDWDPALADAVRAAGVAVHEEELRADLLDAMQTAGAGAAARRLG